MSSLAFLKINSATVLVLSIVVSLLIVTLLLAISTIPNKPFSSARRTWLEFSISIANNALPETLLLAILILALSLAPVKGLTHTPKFKELSAILGR